MRRRPRSAARRSRSARRTPGSRTRPSRPARPSRLGAPASPNITRRPLSRSTAETSSLPSKRAPAAATICPSAASERVPSGTLRSIARRTIAPPPCVELRASEASGAAAVPPSPSAAANGPAKRGRPPSSSDGHSSPAARSAGMLRRPAPGGRPERCRPPARPRRSSRPRCRRSAPRSRASKPPPSAMPGEHGRHPSLAEHAASAQDERVGGLRPARVHDPSVAAVCCRGIQMSSRWDTGRTEVFRARSEEESEAGAPPPAAAG